MAQDLLVYVVVAVAAVWVVWAVVLPGRALRARFSRNRQSSKGSCDRCGG